MIVFARKNSTKETTESALDIEVNFKGFDHSIVQTFEPELADIFGATVYISETVCFSETVSLYLSVNISLAQTGTIS